MFRRCVGLRLLLIICGTAGTQLLLLDKCVVSFNCPGGICWPEIVTATISRAPHDGPPRPITAELRVILENRADLGPEWVEYQPPVIALTVTVSTVATRCGGRVGHSFCACAVTVDAGSEWIEVDVCPDPVDRREPTLRRSAPAGRGLQLHVLETRPDSAWLITSGSGLVVRLHAFPVDQDRSEDESPAGRRRALSITVSVRSHDASRSVERWAELLPPLLEDCCQVAALSQSPAEQEGLQCAGSCAGGGCIQQGEEVVNDHRPNEWVPRVTSVGQQGLCDLASASCVAISIQGRHLWPSVGLRCRVRQDDQAWNIAPATYRSAEEVQCHLPAASVRRLRHTADVVPWTIQVSYNGVSWSDAVVLKTYNSDCQICRERNGSVSCAPVIDSCIINDDGCRGGRPVTCQTVGPACQHGLCVEDSRGAICVCHPGYIGTHCQIRETPPDFITLAEEMGDEALYAPREALDFRYR
ncbi:von Willebrand factor D and EGF domain-containing protein [Amphibalanus amphitrite]|uniref:von Willebrand factor D and EGF domain-containing protein n=1 Tax=Amphibalanus amphitrite TaxID=1232801 RepID=A0A6A4VB48_AMPAM|nr:von Willebrand factor D and EGF domain-containing protein [Amphibalanus amphitrite]